MIVFLYTLLTSIIAAIGFPVGWILSLVGHTYVMKRLVPPSKITTGGTRRIWIHAASVGESMIALSMASEIKKKYPDAVIFVSVNTAAGLDRISSTVRESDKPVIDDVFYAPFDQPLITRSFVRKLQPSLYMIVETELWPSMILSLNKASVPIAIINGKLSIRSFRRYYTFRFAMKSIVKMIALVCVQSRSYTGRFHRIGVPREKIEVLGNVKFDGLPDRDRYDYKALGRKMGIPGNAHVFVAGSTRPGEEPVIFRAFSIIREQYPDTLLVCAPRHLNRIVEVEKYLKESKLSYKKRSAGEHLDVSIDCVLLLDTIGELIDMYACADVAFVGGSLRDFSGHNPLEPAALGIPVIFGPYMEQTGSKELLTGGAASLVHDEDEIADFIRRLFSDETLRQNMTEAGPEVVSRFKGTLTRTLRLIESRGLV